MEGEPLLLPPPLATAVSPLLLSNVQQLEQNGLQRATHTAISLPATGFTGHAGAQTTRLPDRQCVDTIRVYPRCEPVGGHVDGIDGYDCAKYQEACQFAVEYLVIW